MPDTASTPRDQAALNRGLPDNLGTFTASLTSPSGRPGVERAASGAGPDAVTIRGHAAVFNLLSHDLGGFREEVAPGAFRDVLATDPDTFLVQDHNTLFVLGRTRNKTLELREDARGLHVWDRFPETTFANDLAVLMERGDIDQMSFKFTIDEEEWAEDAEGNVTSRILRVGELFDVTVCAQGAYPQTDAQLVRSRYQRAIDLGRVPNLERAESSAASDSSDAETDPIAAPEPGGTPTQTVGDSADAQRRRRIALARAKSA